MIYDTLTNMASHSILVPALKTIISILDKENLYEKSVGEYKTNSDSVRYTLSLEETSFNQIPYEMHRNETIVQIILSGKELFSLTWREHTKGLPYDEQLDCMYLEGDPISVINASENHFILFFPGEPFRSSGAIESKALVRKAVFTIKD